MRLLLIMLELHTPTAGKGLLATCTKLGAMWISVGCTIYSSVRLTITMWVETTIAVRNISQSVLSIESG